MLFHTAFRLQSPRKHSSVENSLFFDQRFSCQLSIYIGPKPRGEKGWGRVIVDEGGASCKYICHTRGAGRIFIEARDLEPHLLFKSATLEISFPFHDSFFHSK
jgi:hypothetical protein